MALDSRGLASPRRLRPRNPARLPQTSPQPRLLRGIAWGLLFAAPVWLLLLALALWLVHTWG